MLRPKNSAILLIAGTSIGAGMLALPASTAKLGFPSSAALLFLSWYIMYLSALLMLEVNLVFPAGANIISMSASFLGSFGKVFAWTIYLLLLYVLNSAYMSALSDMLYLFSGTTINHALATLIVVLFFLLLLYSGKKFIDSVNRVLMLGLVLSFVMLVYLFFGHIEPAKAQVFGWFGVEKALPMLATSFGFHIIIPSLRTFLGEDEGELSSAILYGSLIPLVIYLIWQFLVFTTVPFFGANGLISVWQVGSVGSLIALLMHSLNSPVFTLIINLFSFFIITTSFIGVSLSLFDFLVDGINIKKTNRNSFLIALLTLVPPVIVVLANIKSFFKVLSFAGILVALLLCLLPLVMVIIKRHIHGKKEHIFVGPLGLFLVSFFAFSVIILEIVNNFI